MKRDCTIFIHELWCIKKLNRSLRSHVPFSMHRYSWIKIARVHLQWNNLYVSQKIEQENLTVNQVLVPIFFQKQVIKTFLRQELFMSTFRLSKQMSKGTRSSTLFLYPCYYGENHQKLFLKYFFIWKIQKKFQWFGIPKKIISHHKVYFYNSRCSAGSYSHFIFHYSYLP